MAINEGPEEFNLDNVERDKLMARQLDVSLEPILGMACKALLKSEELLQISESTALTFTSNHACRGMWIQASESKNAVPDSKTVAMTGLKDAFVKRGSPVQVRSSAYVFNPVTATI